MPTMIRHILAQLGTLRWRLTLFYCLLLAILLVAFSIFVYSRFQATQKKNEVTRLADMAMLFQPNGVPADQLKQALAASKFGSTDNALQKLMAQQMDEVQQSVERSGNGGNLDGLYVALLDGKGKVIATNQSGATSPKFVNMSPHLEPVPTTPDPKAGKFLPYTYDMTIDEMVSAKSADGLQQQAYQVPGMAYVLPLWIPDSNADPAQSATPNGYLVLVAPTQQDIEALNQLATFLAYGMAGAILLGLLLGLPLARLGLRPLERIAETADKIGEGDLAKRVPLPRRRAPESVRDEVQQLGRAFNTMLDRIEAAFVAQQKSEARMRRFAADASHELRSPLTVLGGYLDVLLMGAKDDPAQQERILLAMKRENDRLSRLVVDMLLLTRIDANGSGVLRLQPVSVGELVEQAGNNMRVLMGGRNFIVDITPQARASWVLGDPDHLYRVLSNLLDNAVHYTPEGGEITLSASIECDNARLMVADTGCGIEAGQLPHVFDRFYRADASRARETGNAGLGLPICKSLVEAHGGRISVESTPGSGTRFTVDLPLLQDDAAVRPEVQPRAVLQTA
jgi:two-component system OmpR family sensor kinase